MDTFRILIIQHFEWRDDAGAPLVNYSLAREFSRLGHHVDKFDIFDAVKHRNKLTGIFSPLIFPEAAQRHVRRHGFRYDIIQAEQGALPQPKERLGFRGLLVAQSNGLAHFHERFLRTYEREGRGKRGGSLAGNLLRRAVKRMERLEARVECSFRNADLIVLLNEDEASFVRNLLGEAVARKIYVRPNALSEAFLQALDSSQGRIPLPGERLSYRRVVSVANWHPRKGTEDWPRIVRLVREADPAVRFTFLGTLVPEREVLQAFAAEDRTHIRVVPRFTQGELPDLLATGTVGVLPSYMEGFPIALIEMLAVGLPVVVYDIPGPRQVARLVEESLVVEVGRADRMARRIVEFLGSPEVRYAGLARRAVQVAARYRWPAIARDLLEIYRRRLEEVRAPAAMAWHRGRAGRGG